MTVTEVRKDTAARTITITSEFAASRDRLWQLWADPRQLERWWGPPTYPATFVEHDLSPGANASYYMTGPEGQEYHGWWRVVSVDPPAQLVFEDGFGDDSGSPHPDLPVSLVGIELVDVADGRSRMVITTTFPSSEAMELVLSMGAEEGMRSALGQIDQIVEAA